MRSASPLAPAELRGNRLWMRNYTISLRSWYNIAKQKWIPQIMRMILRWNDMDIKKVAVLGAGAVGSYVIWGLSARRDIELGVVAEGRRGERLAQEGCAVRPSARYSTLQDLDAGRHTEIEMFSGALIRMGRELGIPTPYNEFAYHMIKALEEKNDGRFDYSGPDQEMTWAR